MIQDCNLIHLFPTPIMVLKRDKPHTEEEYDFCLNLQRKSNIGVNTSFDTNVLSREPLLELKNFFTRSINYYLREAYKSTNILSVSQSWSNILNPGERHEVHLHANSIVSACYYFKETTTDTCINFTSPLDAYPTAAFTVSEFNQHNSPYWKLPVQSDSIVLFPSYIRHAATNFSDDVRVNLVCNTIYSRNEVYGHIGRVNQVLI